MYLSQATELRAIRVSKVLLKSQVQAFIPSDVLRHMEQGERARSVQMLCYCCGLLCSSLRVCTLGATSGSSAGPNTSKQKRVTLQAALL